MSANAGPIAASPNSATAAARAKLAVFIFLVLERSDAPLKAACECRHAVGTTCDGDPAQLAPVRRWFEEDGRADGRKDHRSGDRWEKQRHFAQSAEARTRKRLTAPRSASSSSTAP